MIEDKQRKYFNLTILAGMMVTMGFYVYSFDFPGEIHWVSSLINFILINLLLLLPWLIIYKISKSYKDIFIQLSIANLLIIIASAWMYVEMIVFNKTPDRILDFVQVWMFQLAIVFCIWGYNALETQKTDDT